MKKKVLSFILCICVLFSSMFSLVGCSVLRKDTEKIGAQTVLKVGDKVVTQNEVVSAFTSFYSNNSQLLSQANETTIMNSFYNWLTAREIVKQKAAEALEDGKIVYSMEDEEDVWKDVFESFYSQVNIFEKPYYDKEDDYPDWLRDKKQETEEVSFAEYKSIIPSLMDKEQKVSVERIDIEEIKNTKLQALKDYIFEFENGEDEREQISDTYIQNRRNAYADYISYLSVNAKAGNNSKNTEDLLLDTIQRVYDSCYTDKLNELFEQYLLEDYLINTTDGDTVSLSDKEIVKAYMTILNIDEQQYLNETDYVSVMSSSTSSLVLYHYDGEDYFFSVQHILIMDNDLVDLIKALDFYPEQYEDEDGNKQVFNSDLENYNTFLTERNELVENFGLLTKVSTDALDEMKSISSLIDNESYINYYFYDKNATGNTSKYVKLNVTGSEDEKTFTRNDNSETVLEKDTIKMSTKEQVIAAYNFVMGKWNALVDEYIDAADETAKEAVKSETNNVFEDMYYIFDLVDQMTENKTVTSELRNQIKSKVASLLFVELEWIFSSDGLNNKINNKIGYFIPNMKDENGSWVSEFAIKAREILEKIDAGERTNSFVDDFNVTISNYGYHIIKIENLYDAGETLVDMSSIQSEIDIEDEAYVESVVAALKLTYTSTASTETLYDYFKDLIYSTLADEDNGTYFTSKQIEWIQEYYEAGKIDDSNKLSYSQIVELIG